MIIKGNSRCAGRWWAGHLMRADTNERVEVVEISGLGAGNIRDGFSEMEAIASGTHCTNYAYIVSLNPREHEHLTREQWLWAVDRTADELGLAGQPRMVVQHDKEGRQHWHVVFSRIDADSMTAISDSLTYPKHERAARAIEQELELEPVASVLAKDRDTPRPERRPRDYEGFRAQESGIAPQDVSAELQAFWREADSGSSFKAAIEDAGYILAKGDRRDFCVIDQAGSEHSLGRRLGVKAALLRERMADIDQGSLPSVSEARELVAATHEEGDAPEASATPEPDVSTSASTPLDEQQAAEFLAEPNIALAEEAERGLSARFGDNHLPAGLIDDTSDPLAEHRDAATDAVPPDHAEAAPDVSDDLIEDNGEPLEGAAVDDAPTITPDWTEARAGQFSDEGERFTRWERLAAVVRGYWGRFVDLVQDEQSGTPAHQLEADAPGEEVAPDAGSEEHKSWVARVTQSKAAQAATRLWHGWGHRDATEFTAGLKDTAAVVEDILAKGPRQPGAVEPVPQEQPTQHDAAAPVEPLPPAPAAPLEDWERFHHSAHAAPEPEADAPGWERFNQSAHAKPEADAPKPTPEAPEPEQPGPHPSQGPHPAPGPELD